jgi:hypothetical protein
MNHKPRMACNCFVKKMHPQFVSTDLLLSHQTHGPCVDPHTPLKRSYAAFVAGLSGCILVYFCSLGKVFY